MTKTERNKIMQAAKKRGWEWTSRLKYHGEPLRFEAWFFESTATSYCDPVRTEAPTRALAEEAALQAAKVLLEKEVKG